MSTSNIVSPAIHYQVLILTRPCNKGIPSVSPYQHGPCHFWTKQHRLSTDVQKGTNRTDVCCLVRGLDPACTGQGQKLGGTLHAYQCALRLLRLLKTPTHSKVGKPSLIRCLACWSGPPLLLCDRNHRESQRSRAGRAFQFGLGMPRGWDPGGGAHLLSAGRSAVMGLGTPVPPGSALHQA